MIKALRRKFIFTAMISLGILLFLVVGCITVGGYVQMERSSDEMMEAALSSRQPDFDPGKSGEKQMFGYQIPKEPPAPVEYFVVTAKDSTTVTSIKNQGRAEENRAEKREELEKLIAQIDIEKETEGKISSYKYRIMPQEEGGYRMVFLDNSIQVAMLSGILWTACIISGICMVLMFLIVWMISGKAIRPIAVSMEKQKQFVTNAGHEIKTPLAIMMTNTDALTLHMGENKWTKNIQSQIVRMNELVRQMLFLAKMDEGKSTMILETVSWDEIVRETAGMFYESAKQKKIQITVQCAEEIQVQGNRDALSQLSYILMDNAVKYSEAEKEILVVLKKEGKRKRLAVRNHVAAHPEVPPDTLFDRFYRSDLARTQKNGGYGIGLSIAQTIVQQHHGKIKAAYEETDMVSFTVELP